MKFRVLEENNNEIQRRFREVKLIYKTIYAMNDEGAWEDSLYLIPDDADEEDLREYFALNEEDFKELVDMFNDIYKDYHEGGLYNASLEVENYAHKKDKELGLSPIVNLKPKTRVTEGETKAEIEKTADRLNYPKSQIVKSDKGNYFLAPRGIEKTGAKKAYANCREKSEDKEKCSKIAWSVEKKNEGLDTGLKELEQSIRKEEILTEGVWFLPFKQVDVDKIRELLKEPVTYQELLDSPVTIIGSDEFYDKLEDNIVDNPNEDAREFIKQELGALVKDYRAREENYQEKATEEILKQLEELTGIEVKPIKVERKQIKVTEEKTDLGDELVKYKGYDIVEFTGFYEIAGEKIDAHNWGIVGGYVKIGNINVPMTLKIKDEQGERVKFDTVDETKKWIDKFDGKFTVELEDGDELTAVIKDEYKQEIEDEKLNEEIKEINKEDCKTVFLTNEKLKEKAKELAEKIDPTEYIDETYQDYKDFINKELSNKVLDESATEQEKNELVKWFEESYEKKTKIAKRLFGESLQEFNEKYKTDEAIFEGLEDNLFRDDKIDSSWANIEVKSDNGNFGGEINLGGEQNIVLNQQVPQVVNMLPNNTMDLGTKVDEFEQMQYQMLQQSLQNPNLPLQPNISAPMTNIQPNPQIAPQVPNFAFNNLNNVSAIRTDDNINMQMYGQNPVANFAPNPNINNVNTMNVGNQNVIDEFVDDRMVRDDDF